MRVALTLALCGLWMACPKSFEAKNPPCDDNSGCTVEVLGNDFPDHVCGRDYTCVPKASVVSDAGGPATVYDAGLINQDAEGPQCRSDQDCDEGEICQSGFCLESGLPPRGDAAVAVDSGAAPADAAVVVDSGVAQPADAGVPDAGGGSGLPDIGGGSGLPDIGGGPIMDDIGGGPILHDAGGGHIVHDADEAPLVQDAE